MGLFQEYMNNKGKVVKPVVDIHGGDPTPKTPPVKPPKEHGSAPYIAKGEKNSKKGFGDLGGTKGSSKEPTPAKIPTAEQAEIVALVSDIMLQDNTVCEALVYQLRNKGLLAPVLAEMLQYRETYNHIAEVMAHETYGPKVCGKLVRAMNEEVAPPLHASLQGEETPSEEDDADDAYDNESEDSEEGIYDGDIDAEMEGGEQELDPNVAADPLMQQDPTMQPGMGQAPMPPGPPQPAMANFQRAMMRRV